MTTGKRTKEMEEGDSERSTQYEAIQINLQSSAPISIAEKEFEEGVKA